MKKEEKRRGLDEVKIWIIMKREGKRWCLDKVKIWIVKKRKKKDGVWTKERFKIV